MWCSWPPRLVGLSISEATTSKAPCSFPSLAALCGGTSWSSGSCSWMPSLQGVIFFCTSAQRSSLSCSPGRHKAMTVNKRNLITDWCLRVLLLLLLLLLYFCLAGSSLQVEAGSDQEQDFSKAKMDLLRNMRVSQISRVVSTHHQPTQKDWETYRILSRKAK